MGGPVNRGSLTLHYEDNSTRKFDYSSSMGCNVINIKPRQRIARAVVASAHFVLFNRKNMRGRQATFSSNQEREYSAEDVGFTRVKSIVRKGCRREASVTVIALSLTAATLFLVVAAVLLYRWRRSRQAAPAFSADTI